MRAALGARRDAPDHFAVPAQATIRRTLARLDADALAAAVGAWLADRQRHDRCDGAAPAQRKRPRQRAVAVDGKTLRGARTQTLGGDGRRDVTFAEDASQVRTGAGPPVMATLRNLVIGCSAGPGRSTSLPRCAATPATHTDPSPPLGSDSDEALSQQK